MFCNSSARALPRPGMPSRSTDAAMASHPLRIFLLRFRVRGRWTLWGVLPTLCRKDGQSGVIGKKGPGEKGPGSIYRVEKGPGSIFAINRAWPLFPIAGTDFLPPREVALHLAQRLVEDCHREVDVLARDRQRRRNAPHRASLGAAPDVHAQAELEAARGRQRTELVIRLARLAVLDELDAAQKPHAAHVADLLVTIHQLAKARGEILAHLAASREQVLLLDRFEHRKSDRRRQRIGHVRRVERKPATMTRCLDLVVRDHGRKRNAAAERLRYGHEIGRHPKMRRGEPMAEPAERRLRLVEDQKHVALARLLRERVEIAFGWNDDA